MLTNKPQAGRFLSPLRRSSPLPQQSSLIPLAIASFCHLRFRHARSRDQEGPSNSPWHVFFKARSAAKTVNLVGSAPRVIESSLRSFEDLRRPNVTVTSCLATIWQVSNYTSPLLVVYDLEAMPMGRYKIIVIPTWNTLPIHHLLPSAASYIYPTTALSLQRLLFLRHYIRLTEDYLSSLFATFDTPSLIHSSSSDLIYTHNVRELCSARCSARRLGCSWRLG